MSAVKEYQAKNEQHTKKEQQKMSLGAFLTDESESASKTRSLPNKKKTDIKQRWDLGLMKWRICQFVSVLRCMLFGNLLTFDFEAGMNFPGTQ